MTEIALNQYRPLVLGSIGLVKVAHDPERNADYLGKFGGFFIDVFGEKETIDKGVEIREAFETDDGKDLPVDFDSPFDTGVLLMVLAANWDRGVTRDDLFLASAKFTAALAADSGLPVEEFFIMVDPEIGEATIEALKEKHNGKFH